MWGFLLYMWIGGSQKLNSYPPPAQRSTVVVLPDFVQEDDHEVEITAALRAEARVANRDNRHRATIATTR